MVWIETKYLPEKVRKIINTRKRKVVVYYTTDWDIKHCSWQGGSRTLTSAYSISAGKVLPIPADCYPGSWPSFAPAKRKYLLTPDIFLVESGTNVNLVVIMHPSLANENSL